eukprot:m.122998 g.122998  ORF g.122998 m.122998 type:complete len:371 (+) comp28952_c0_seq1:389-1501(+)
MGMSKAMLLVGLVLQLCLITPLFAQQPSIVAQGTHLTINADDLFLTLSRQPRSQSVSDVLDQVRSHETSVASATTAIADIKANYAQVSTVTALDATVKTATQNISELAQALESVKVNQTVFQHFSNTTIVDFADRLSQLNATLIQVTDSLAQMNITLRLAALEGPPRPTKPKSCKDLKLKPTEAGLYTVYPQNNDQIEVYCAAITTADGSSSGYADWTIIASQADRHFGHALDDAMFAVTPTTTNTGASHYYFQRDLRDFSREIFTSNENGQSHVFNTSRFTGPLILGGKNFVASEGHFSKGILAGNNHPTMYHFQIGTACSRTDPDCYVGHCEDACPSPWSPRDVPCCSFANADDDQQFATDGTLVVLD